MLIFKYIIEDEILNNFFKIFEKKKLLLYRFSSHIYLCNIHIHKHIYYKLLLLIHCD